MELWFTEKHTKNVNFSIKVSKQLYGGKSEFQKIDVFKTPEFGKILTLDGLLMVTEKDEFIYHEMITHVPMATHIDAKKILVIGAGDGGTLRELCKYATIETIDLIEIDEQVVAVCKEFLPQTACGFNDERVNVHFLDGLKFVRNIENEYDLIIVDSTDPFGPGEGLFTKEFYGNCCKALKNDGILVNQIGSTYYSGDSKDMRMAYGRIKDTFGTCYVYGANIPTYPSGFWMFGYASKTKKPLTDLKETAWKSFELSTKYYNTDIHKGSFAMPNYIREKLF